MQGKNDDKVLYSIDFKDLSYGDHSFEFKVDDKLYALYEGCEVSGGECDVTVEMQRSESMLNLSVEIAGDAVVECDRCLEPCSVEIDYLAPLIVRFSDEEELAGEYDGEVMWLPTASSNIDLTHYIYESILLSLPYQRVHEEGECDPEMLKQFRIVTGEEFAKIEEECEESDNETMPADELAKLQALKEMMTKE
ncbi:MAG: DUF177 domain-containing protein [Rikenellaceae bacterium]